MMKTGTLGLLLLATVMAPGLAACTPRAIPAPAAPPPPPYTSTAQPVQASFEDAAWAKVVAAAKKEGRVSGYTSGLVVGAEDALAKAFKEKYGIAVEFISGQSPAQLERVRTEYAAGKLTTSFAGFSQTQLMPLRDEGMLDPWGVLPSLAEKDVWFFPPQYDEAGTLISFGKYWVLSYVNTNLVKPEDEPRSYLDLVKPQWKGKMVAPDLSVPMFAVTYASLKYHKALDVDDFYRKLGQQGVSFRASLADAATALARGEASIYVSAHESYLTRFVAEGAPVKPVYFKEGVPLRNIMAFGLIKGSPHPNTARLLVNWLLSSEGEAIYAQAKQTSPTRRDVADFSPVSKIITPQAKTYFVQNEGIDNESTRVVREKVLHKLLGVE